LNFDYSCFDICLDPVAIVNSDERVVYINPSFEVMYEYSNQFISKAKPNFSDLMKFNDEKIGNLKDGLYYNLIFSTSKSKTGSAQVAVLRKSDVMIIFLRDLEFEDRLQAKYKALVSSLRDHNKKLTVTLEKGYEQLYEIKELLSILENEPKFCLIKTDQDFKIKDFTNKEIEKDLVLNLTGFNLLKILTHGKAEDLMYFEKSLRPNSNISTRLAHPMLSVSFEFAQKKWRGSFYLIRDQELNINYYFSLVPVMKDLAHPALSEDKNLEIKREHLTALIYQNKQFLVDDLSPSNDLVLEKVFRGFFWQSLLKNLNLDEFKDLVDVHMNKPQIGFTLKILALKNLEINLKKNSSSIKPSNESRSLKDDLEDLRDLFNLNKDLKFKFPKDAQFKHLACILGVLLAFEEFTKIKLIEIESKIYVKNMQINLYFKSQRDSGPIYDFIKKLKIVNFEMEKNMLSIEI
jgi:hypothetical protein